MRSSKNKLHSMNWGGNWHSLATYLNKKGWANYLVSVSDATSSGCVVLLRMPASLVWEIRENDRAYISDPHGDDEVQS